MRKEKNIVSLAFAALMFAATAASADNTQWIKDTQNSECSDESKTAVAQSVRNQIESSVKRAEAAIPAPAALGDLACLSGLMNAPLSTFSRIGGIADALVAGLDGAISSVGDTVTRKICNFASEQWSSLTDPVTEGLDDIVNDAYAINNVWDNYDLTSGWRTSGSGSASTAWSYSSTSNDNIKSNSGSTTSGSSIWDSITGP